MTISLQKIKYYLKKLLKYSLLTSVLLVILFFVCDYFFPLKVDVSYSQCVYNDKGVIVHVFLAKDQKWRLKVSNDEVSPLLKKVFLAKEDQYFYQHYGFNPLSIIRAIVNNILQLKKTSGASTITMQVARLLEPKQRTYWHKILEVFRAIQLENKYTKDEILNLYFNLIPYGGNVEGIKSISVLYLQKNVKKLNLAEAVSLAIIPNRPSSLNIKKNIKAIIVERNRWLKVLDQELHFNKELLNDALKEPFSPKYKPIPYLIPHLANRLIRKYPQFSDIKTTINSELQFRATQQLQRYVSTLQKFGIYNGAVLVVDNNTKAVVAYVGSNNFFDQEHGGQCDGVYAVRSPGSTLKPLLYALAFDKGLLTFQTILEDIPCDINGYRPQNFDRKFRGKISVEDALLYSLNIPAVKVLDSYDVKKFKQKLIDINLKQVSRDKSKIGHSVILGGCGASLEEITALFAGFANKGKYYPITFFKDTLKRKQISIAMTSEAAAYMVSKTLSQLSRPDVPNYKDNLTNAVQIAWKTGTSYGKRDAWCFGYTPQYTVGVWLGNFDNSPAAELVGVDVAAPLLFEIFQTLPKSSKQIGFIQPSTLHTRLVCTETGLVPNHFCNSFTNDLFIPGVSSFTTCEHLKEFPVSENEKIAYCVYCVPDLGFKKNWYPNLSPEMISFYESNHIIYKKIPEHNPLCTSNIMQYKLGITHPLSNKIYYTDEDSAQIRLECNAAPAVKKVHWFVNDRYIGNFGKSEPVFVKLPPQKVKVSCTDDMGNTAHVYSQIKLME